MKRESVKFCFVIDDMGEKSGSRPPPAFNRWNRTSLDSIRTDIVNRDRCMCCLKKLVNSRRLPSGKNKRAIELNCAFSLHIAAYALARADNNPWPGETQQRNRFHDIQSFVVCKTCFIFCQRKYDYQTFSEDNTEKFNFLQNHVTAEIQFGLDVSQRVADEIRHDDEEANRDIPIGLNADNSFPAAGHDFEEPQRPPSPIINADEDEEFNDAFFHFGMADAAEDPMPESDSDSDYEPNDQENIDPFSQNQLNLNCPAQWSPHPKIKYEGFLQLLAHNDLRKCLICFNEVQDPQRRNLLTLENLWDLCEYARLHILNSNPSHFVCSNCICNDMTWAAEGKDNIYYRIVSNPPFARTEPNIKRKCEQDGPLILRQNVNAKEWHKIQEKKILERDREQNLNNANFQNFTFATLTESSAVHLFGMQKHQLIQVFNEVSNGLKDGSKFKKENKFLIFVFYCRHNLAMRAMSSILNISATSISHILTEVEQATQRFAEAHTTMPSHDELVDDLTTAYCKLVHMQEDPDLQVIIADGGYSFLNNIGMSGADSTDNWSGHKHRPLRKYMTICSTTGHILFSNTSWPGRLSDNDIMKSIFKGEVESAGPLLELIKSHKTLLICDRGFDGFKAWVESPEMAQRYPLLKVIIPVNQTDNNQRYPKDEVNRSRKEVTSIREVVERIHGHQKKFLILCHQLNLEFFQRHWLSIHRFVNAILNRFGRLTPRQPTFRAEERYHLIHNNQMIIDTNLSDLIVQPGHDLEWKKRSSRIWKEYFFDDPELLERFPVFDERDLNSLNGGSYHLRKARGYEVQVIEYLKDRKRQMTDGGSIRSVSTVSTLNASFAMKIQVLTQSCLQRYFGDRFTSCIRLDIPSFHSKYRKFRTTILIRNMQGERPQFSFGCICSTGLRTNPCTHAIVLLYLYTFRFKRDGFPVPEQRLPVV